MDVAHIVNAHVRVLSPSAGNELLGSVSEHPLETYICTMVRSNTLIYPLAFAVITWEVLRAELRANKWYNIRITPYPRGPNFG